MLKQPPKNIFVVQSHPVLQCHSPSKWQDAPRGAPRKQQHNAKGIAFRCLFWIKFYTPRRRKARSRESSSRIRPIHGRNFSCHSRPLKLAFEGLSPLDLLELIPFQELIGKSQMRLNDHIEPASTDETTARVRSVISQKRESGDLTMLVESSSPWLSSPQQCKS